MAAVMFVFSDDRLAITVVDGGDGDDDEENGGNNKKLIKAFKMSKH